MTKESKKEKIIECAIRCFNEKGIEQTKIVDIAKYAEVNHSLVLYYFPNFEDLGKAVIESLIHELNTFTVKAIKSNKNDANKLLESYTKSAFKLVKRNKEKFSIWLHFYYKASHDKQYKELNKFVRDQGRERINSILKVCIEQQLCKKLNEQEIEQTTNLMLGLITGNLIVSMTEGENLIDEYAQLTFKTIRDYLQNL